MPKKNPSTLNDEEIDLIVSGRIAEPFSFLGVHPLEGEEGFTAVRVFIPGAESVEALDIRQGKGIICERIHEQGLFEALVRGVDLRGPYRLKADFGDAGTSLFYDCYSFLPFISDHDLYLFNEGTNYRIYERLGAHPCVHQSVKGTLFAVWAPGAIRVSLVGDFNQWDGRRHQMRSRGSSGVWEIFVPHIKSGTIYKFEIYTKSEEILLKSDPFAYRFEQRPKTASIVEDISGFDWNDKEWMTKRKGKGHLAGPISIYEMHPGSWRRRKEEGSRWLTYREMADELIPYVKEMGFNFIEFLPLSEHPFDGSWGYQVTGFYAPTSRFGTAADLMYLIDSCHGSGIGVILDWVPAHFPSDPHALEYFDGTHLFEHEDPRQGFQKDWNTLIFNYGRNEVKNFLIANALYWFDKYHIDGIRVDAVASMLYLDYSRDQGEWVPNRFGGRENLEAIEFIKELNTRVYEFFPGAITIAEESTAWPGVTRPVYLGGLGFLFKWNMGWMHDMLNFMSKDPVHRRYQMESLTFSLIYAFSENFILPLSHDEVVHGKASLLSKMPGDDWQKFANLRLLLGYMYAEPGKKTLFMGSELGQWSEWDHDSELDWDLLLFPRHRMLREFVKDLNRLYQNEAALHEKDFDHAGFEWIDFRDSEATVVSFLRKGNGDGCFLVFVFNFTPVPRKSYRVGVPQRAFYREIMNSDSAGYGGSGVVTIGTIESRDIPWHGRDLSISLDLPPLAMVVLRAETRREG